jgi:hypothetical protein
MALEVAPNIPWFESRSLADSDRREFTPTNEAIHAPPRDAE